MADSSLRVVGHQAEPDPACDSGEQAYVPPFAFVLSDGWQCPVCHRRGSSHADECFVGRMAWLLEATDNELVERRHEVNACADLMTRQMDEMNRTRAILREFNHVEGEPLDAIAQVALDAYHHAKATFVTHTHGNGTEPAAVRRLNEQSANRRDVTERPLRERLETVQTLDLRSKRTRGALLALCDIAEAASDILVHGFDHMSGQVAMVDGSFQPCPLCLAVSRLKEIQRG